MNPLAERRQDASFLNSYSAWEKKIPFLRDFTFSWWSPDNQQEREVPHTACPTVLRAMGRIEAGGREKYQRSELGL